MDTFMSLLFENKYLVSEEGGAKYHSSLQNDAETPPVRTSGRGGAILRVVGLCVSAFIIVIALLMKENLFLFLGLALAAVYVYRIFYTIQRNEKPAAAPPFRPHSAGLVWKRVIRFGETIEVDDPRCGGSYSYENITHTTENSAYCTLWFSDRSTLRVSKKGFTIGTYEEFLPFIEHTIEQNRLNGKGAEELS